MPRCRQLHPEELGDYDQENHVGDYVQSLKLALRQSDQLERKVMELHQKREPGQEPQIAIDEFLSIARNCKLIEALSEICLKNT